MAKKIYTLTRTPHRPAEGEPVQEPELLETYIDSAEGEMWVGGYLRHEVGQSEEVPEYVARVVMGDRGLAQHYECLPALPPIETVAATEPAERITEALPEPKDVAAE